MHPQPELNLNTLAISHPSLKDLCIQHADADPQICFSKWSPKLQCWAKCNYFEQNPKFHQEEVITTLCFNVLFDQKNGKQYKPNFYIRRKAKQLKPHIMTFNEVTNTFCQLVKQKQWIREQYWITQLLPNEGSYGNILITKIQPIFRLALRPYSLPLRVETGFFGVRSQKGELKVICISSTHLTARVQNAKQRQAQLESLNNKMEKFMDKIVSNWVVQGDLNLHLESETEIATKRGFSDAWLQKYNLQANPGYTFDSSFNSLINELYWGFEKRRMRLDRIMIKGGPFGVEKIQIVMDSPINGEQREVEKHGFLKGSLLFVNDLVGWRLGREAKERYLYASDHFGLFASLSFDSF